MICAGSEFLGRTCADCASFMYEDNGKKKLMRGTDKPWPRPLGVVTPCHKCPKVPDDAPKDRHGHKHRRYAVEITDKTWATIQHYDECEAVGQFPDDAIVRRNAAIIKRVRDQYRRLELQEVIMQVAALRAVQ